MKIGIILFSMMAAAGTWWWNTRCKTDGRQTMRQQIKIVTRSLIAGVVVYFTLMAIAFIYLILVGQ